MKSTNTDQSSSSPTGAVGEKASAFAEKARDTASRAREKGAEFASEKKEAMADRIENYGSAVEDAAQSFEPEDPNLAWFTHRAADRLEGIAGYLRDRDFRTLRDDAERLARRHPVAFLGGMFVAGVVVGSIVKAGRKELAESGGDERTHQPEWTGESSSGNAGAPEMQPQDVSTATSAGLGGA